MKTCSISISEVTDLLSRAWQRIVAKEGADKIANAIIKTALQKDHRMNPIKDVMEDLVRALRIKSELIEVTNKGPIRSYDLQGMPGIAFMPHLTETVVQLAKKYGVGIVTLKNSGGVDALSTWLFDIPREDCIGLFVWNGGSYTTVPFGSTQPFFGTNPIAYVIPTSNAPLLLDMSTSEIPFMDLMCAIRNGVPVRPGAGIDDLGRPTTDTKSIYDTVIDSDVKLLPMGGGYKGSSIMLLIEILTGALINSKMAREATSNTQIPEEFGGILAAIDISTFTTPAQFKQRVTIMLSQIRSSQPATEFSKVRVPGDTSYEREQDRRKANAIYLDESIISDLKKLAEV